MALQITILACYACIDGTALRKAKEHGSHFTWVLLYTTMAQTIAPLVAAATIIDAPEGSGGKGTVSLLHHDPPDLSRWLQRKMTTKLLSTCMMPVCFWHCSYHSN